MWSVFTLPLLFVSAFQDHLPSKTPQIDQIVIEKSLHRMSLMSGDKNWRSYKVALSRGGAGAKEREGDHKVPEGKYVVDAKNPNSRFHLALHISYPNATDAKRAQELGAKPGGNIEIHGVEKKYEWAGSLQRELDWTDGCIAVTNAEIEEIYPLVKVGTPVVIRP